MLPLRDNIPSRYPPVMTVGLIILSTLVFLFTITLPAETVRKIFFLYGLVPARVLAPGLLSVQAGPGARFFPFISSMFLHGNWSHLISNMWALWLFGDNIEDRLGSFRFLVFYLFSGIVAGVIHILANPSGQVPAIGASGAVAGVMGAYFLLYPTAKIVTLVPVFFFPMFLNIPALLYLGGWFFMQLFQGAISFLGPGAAGGIAWWAHVGGFLTGLVMIRRFLRGVRGRVYRYPDGYGP